MFKKIFVPIDGSDCSRQALNLAASLAQEQQAALLICTVLEPTKPGYAMAFGTPEMIGGLYDNLRAEAKKLVENAAASVAGQVRADSIVREGPPADEIVAGAASSEADLIVMGSHGRSGLSRMFLGSVAEGVLRTATAPVLIVRYVGAQ